MEAEIVEGGRVESRRKYESREPSISWPPAGGGGGGGSVEESVGSSAPVAPPKQPPPKPFDDGPPVMAAAAAAREKDCPPLPLEGNANRWIEPAEALLPSRGTPTPA